ncbi:MAG TPA: phosphate acyltransferase PlsX [Candidatus Limnocylindrales bacterium]|nr:phosphate acyltransferase PlsX [Candidatus Limnocylindrales bacterium]
MVAALDRPFPSTAGSALDDGRGVTIAVDAMGGDHGPSEVVPGALDHALANPQDRVILVGDEPTLRRIAGALPPNVSIVHASEVVGMDEHPAMALREKKDSSILVATDLVKRGEADAVVTAGHSGAGMGAAVLRLGRLRGVDRPALAVPLTTEAGTLVLLDIGANTDSSAENLAQYARMGSIFSERVLGVTNPRVALLSIGEEKGKGDLRIQQATELLDQTDLNFVGNIEGKDLTRHQADVVVCDAVLGNVVIKFFEGLSTYIFDMLRREFRGSLRGKVAGLLMRPGIARIRAVFDYERVGGSPLLGVKGTVIITHGRAKRRMIGYGVGVAATMARTRVPELIAEALRPAPDTSEAEAPAGSSTGDAPAGPPSAGPPSTGAAAAVESAS